MQAGSLEALFDEAKAKVLKFPTDFSARSALWQLFAARGDLDRARKQLDMMLHLDSSWAMEVQACHGLLTAEQVRSQIFDGLASPVCLGIPPAWFAKLVATLPMVTQSQFEAANKLISDVRDEVEPRTGSINDVPFQWVCDGDARIGPCLELIVQGRYFWAPWQSLRSFVTRPPTEVRDLIWQHAMIEISEEGPIEGFIPVRYPRPRNGAEVLSQRTEWESIGSENYLGFGQKCLMTDETSYGYLDVRSLSFAARSLS